MLRFAAFLVAVATILPAGNTFGAEDPPYRPTFPSECAQTFSLTVRTADGGCLSITGFIEGTFFKATYDTGITRLVGGAFVSGLQETDFGPAQAVVGITQQPYFDMALGETIWREEVSDAYVTIGDAISITAGKRNLEWGSIATIYNEEPFWLGDLFQPGLAPFANDNRWDYYPYLGGHVVQVSARLPSGITLQAALEGLEGTGIAVGVIRYDGHGVNAYVAGIVDDVLGDSRYRNFQTNSGLSIETENARIRAHATTWWTDGVDPTFNAGLIVERDFDLFDVTLSGGLHGQDDSSMVCSWSGCTPVGRYTLGWGVGATLGLDITPIVRNELGASVGAYDAGGAARAADKLTVSLTESLGVSGEFGLIHSRYDSGFSTYYYASTRLDWRPGAGVTASAEAKQYSTGTYELVTKMEKRF